MSIRIVSLAIVVLWFPTSWPTACAEDPTPAAPWAGTLHQPEGRRLPGRLEVDAATQLRFVADGSVRPPAIATGSVVTFDGSELEPTTGSPPFRVDLGLDRRISGRLSQVNESQVRLEVSSTRGGLQVAREGVRSVVQRLGELQILDDDFETPPGTRWTLVGEPELADDPKAAGHHSLRVPAGGTSVTRRLELPIASGRLELAFFDQGTIVPDHQCFVDLQFRSASGPETVRVILGWSEESLSVESPGGPALAVQRLARNLGWHRLSLRFGPKQTAIAVDGNVLAHGKGPGGPLVEIRLGSRKATPQPAPPKLAAFFDDFRLVRFAESGSVFEVDPTQDEIRLTGGDQIFGTLVRADAIRIQFRVEPKLVELPWSEVSGLHFRRNARPSRPIQGTWLRVQWRVAPGDEPGDDDRIDGALLGLDANGLTLDVPYIGPVTVPRRQLRRLEILGHGERIVVDPTSHHLGNAPNHTAAFDPPQPEGRALERTVELAQVPSGPATLSLDVLHMAGEASGLPYFDLLKKGELRTKVAINHKTFDYLNHYITSKNEAPERIQVPIPSGLLHPGSNSIRIVQTGTAADPNNLHDLGILEIAIEFPHNRAAQAAPETP